MEQFEQLLTCAICLDRYRNPKLLPCQHSFCMEPCMDGLVDYVRRQVKCPECRAEHRIPYQGVQGYPTNVTLQRFLELHIEITGELPDPTSGQTMKRCGVCSEKAYVTICVHCDKEICADCKGAHMDILRREISRINNQVRRAMHRLQDILAIVEKNMLALQLNCTSVSEEVDEIYRRLAKALKDRTEYLRGEIDRYLTTELKNLSTLKENLEQEISNIQSNCDLANQHMQSEDVEWDDCELMDAKEIFLKTIDFIRNFEAETGDYNRRVRFAMAHDPNQLVLHVAGYGELTIHMPHQPLVGFNTNSPSGGNMLQPPGPGLMRSKSDHRLASQYRAQEERGYENVDQSGRVSPLGGRKFGERHGTRNQGQGGYDSRYGRSGGGEYGDYSDNNYGDNESNRLTTRSRLRSRFGRHAGGGEDSDNDGQSNRTVRFSDTLVSSRERERERVLDTEDVSKGPLSGITRLYDSPRVMKRIQESKTKESRKEPETTPAVKPQIQVQRKPIGAATPPTRQVSEEDEISRIKRQNKASGSDATPETPTRPLAAERVSSIRRDEDREPSSPTSRTSPASTRSTPASEQSRKTPVPATASSEEESDEESVSSIQKRKTPTPVTQKPASRRSSGGSDVTATSQSGGSSGAVGAKKTGRSASSDSSTSSESTGSSSGIKSTGAAFTTEELKRQFMARSRKDDKDSQKNSMETSSGHSTPTAASTPRSRFASSGSQKDSAPPTPTSTQPRFQSRFLPGGNRNASLTSSIPATKDTEEEDVEEEEEETETSSESEETSSSEEEAPVTTGKAETTAPMEKTDIGPLLARSAQARDTTTTRKSSRDEGYGSSRYGSNDSSYRSPYLSANKDSESGTGSSGSKYMPRNRIDDSENIGSRYGAGAGAGAGNSTGFTSRFLNKSKSSAVMSPEEEDDRKAVADESRYPAGRTRFAAFKDRKARLARSKSTHTFGGDDVDDFDDSTYSPSAYLASKNATLSSSNELSRSRSSHALKSRENSPERSTVTAINSGGEKDGAALSSWARYLKNKYGNRGKEGKESGGSAGSSSMSSGTGAGTSAASRRLSLGLPLRHNSASMESSDDDQKNTLGSPNSPTAATAATAAPTGFAAVGSTPRSQYMQKRRQLFKIGNRGSEPGYFTWPRGIAVGPDNSIVVADSSNHRVQVFDSNGIFLKEFGCYGNAEGEFDCLAGVAVNRIGQYIIADRYNHRVQVLDPSGRFLRAFGSQGITDGKFNYPWGVTTDALGFIYVCDKENHRIQVFQSDGTFVGKFGSHGSKLGQLEHPHYIAISNTNRVIVTDCNNHRIQVFDVNGRVLSSFGSEGSEEGQFKFPRGVAVDDQGFISVGDSGNNRIQIFNPDGTFLKAFGSWGSGDGEFKGLEGVAVMSNGNILVCDRENHRIQVF